MSTVYHIDNLNYIARLAATNGNITVVLDMLCRGADDYIGIIYNSRITNNPDVEYTVEEYLYT